MNPAPVLLALLGGLALASWLPMTGTHAGFTDTELAQGTFTAVIACDPWDPESECAVVQWWHATLPPVWPCQETWTFTMTGGPAPSTVEATGSAGEATVWTWVESDGPRSHYAGAPPDGGVLDVRALVDVDRKGAFALAGGPDACVAGPPGQAGLRGRPAR